MSSSSNHANAKENTHTHTYTQKEMAVRNLIAFPANKSYQVNIFFVNCILSLERYSVNNLFPARINVLYLWISICWIKGGEKSVKGHYASSMQYFWRWDLSPNIFTPAAKSLLITLLNAFLSCPRRLPIDLSDKWCLI